MNRTLIAMLAFLVAGKAWSSEIREFDLKTIERLGNELTRVSQQPDRGANTAARKLARQTAINALNGRLFDIRYDYIVLDDPERTGFLVYAVGQGPKRGDVVLAGHFRVSVSADGAKAVRLDALSRSLMIENKLENHSPKGYRDEAAYVTQIVSNKPIETVIYTSSLLGRPIFVGTPDGRIWKVNEGQITIDRSKPGRDSMGGAVQKAFGR